MLKITLSCLLSIYFVCSLSAQTSQEYNKHQLELFNQEKQQYDIYKKKRDTEFESYLKEEEKVFNKYREKLGFFWKDPKLSTKKEWISYSKDKKTRTDVDFSKNTITIETIAMTKKEATQKLKYALEKVVTVDTKTAQDSDPLEQEIAKIKKPNIVVDGEVDSKPILSSVIFENKPTKKSAETYAKKQISTNKIDIKTSDKIKHANIYTLNITLPEDTMVKRSKIYFQEVKKQADKQRLPIALIFAVMQTESSFNPMARSYIPAYGLMQIVPRTAGIDTYYFLYKKKKLVSSKYLYNSTNNIKMGSAYLHLIYYKYLGGVKNLDSRLYCTIAAYNTGVGNVAWAFTHNYNVKNSIPFINTKSPKEVYKKLLKDLKYEEPKHYLKKVANRMGAYYRLYGS